MLGSRDESPYYEDYENGARSRIRTNDLLITNQLLCQLSYAGFAYRGGYFTTSGGVWPAL